jgi:hypothetical protein
MAGGTCECWLSIAAALSSRYPGGLGKYRMDLRDTEGNLSALGRGYDDSDAVGEDEEAIAYHEAGHAIAAVLSAVGCDSLLLVLRRAEVNCLC